jgi:phasin family protein
MNDRAYDPNAWMDAYRESFAPIYKAQQEGFKTFERVARFQYAIMGDYLESGLAHAQAAIAAKSPIDFMAKQAELGTQLGEKLRARAQEFSTLANELQGSVATFASDTSSRFAEASSRATSTASRRATAS